MKVKDFIKKLQKYNQDAEIFLEVDEASNFIELGTINAIYKDKIAYNKEGEALIHDFDLSIYRNLDINEKKRKEIYSKMNWKDCIIITQTLQDTNFWYDNEKYDE